MYKQLIKNYSISILLLIFLIISLFIKNETVNQSALVLCFYFLFRWLTNYRKCTISFIECKIRGIKKESGLLYNCIDPIINYNKTNYRFYLYIFILIVLSFNLDNLKNNMNFLLVK